MGQQIEDSDSIRRYLLGELAEEEREQIERRLLSDDEYYQQVLIAEDELTYDFVCDELPAQDKMRFTQYLLPIPERQQDVRFAKALRRYVGENAPPVVEISPVRKERISWLEPFKIFFRRPIIESCLAATLLLALLASVWLATQNRRLRDQNAQLQSPKPPPSTPQDLQEQLASERQHNLDLSADLLRERDQRASVERDLEATRRRAQRMDEPDTPRRPTVATVAAFLLTPGLTRDSGELTKIPIPRGAHDVRLKLDLAANDNRSYRAILKMVGGPKELWSTKALRARVGRGRITISMSLPARILSQGDYQIQLSGETSPDEYEDLEIYYFRVIE